MYKELIGFTSYNLIEVTCNELRDQGQNVLLNIFFGPLVNAARAISVSVNSAVRSFASNFQTAINPQIVKDYASQDYKIPPRKKFISASALVRVSCLAQGVPFSMVSMFRALNVPSMG